MEDFVRKAPMYAMKNKENLTSRCGCYHCMELFGLQEIVQWTDAEQTAICPQCGVDAVLPIADAELLQKVNDYWFG